MLFRGKRTGIYMAFERWWKLRKAFAAPTSPIDLTSSRSPQLSNGGQHHIAHGFRSVRLNHDISISVKSFDYSAMKTCFSSIPIGGGLYDLQSYFFSPPFLSRTIPSFWFEHGLFWERERMGWSFLMHKYLLQCIS